MTCEEDGGPTVELKVGTEDNQHIVSVAPQDGGEGSDFALVYVQTRGTARTRSKAAKLKVTSVLGALASSWDNWWENLVHAGP